jgi:hypothetical protein
MIEIARYQPSMGTGEHCLLDEGIFQGENSFETIDGVTCGLATELL